MENEYIVYLHINIINSKVYVGITKYHNPSKRWSYGYKHNPYLNSAIIKYGWENFKHIILFRRLPKDAACRIERLLIARYRKSNRSYNIANGGEGAKAVSEETKAKLREYRGVKASQYGRKHSRERIEQQREIAKKCWKLQRDHRLKELLRYGFKSGAEHPNYGKHLSDTTKEKLRKALSKKVLMIDKITGEIIREFSSTTKAEQYLDVKGHHISCCCNGKRKTAYGYIWKYKEE